MAKSKTQGANIILSREKTDNPKLCAYRMKDGRLSLYLLYYLGYQLQEGKTTDKEVTHAIRQKRFLNLYAYENPRTPKERQESKDAVELAKRIRFEKEQEMKQRETGYRLETKTDTDFLEYYRDYVANYTKKDLSVIKVSFSRFVDFLRDTPKYRAFSNSIKPSQIDRDMILAFVEYLKKRSYGDGAGSIYARFKKVVKNAVEHDIFTKNPCAGVSIKTDRNALKKAYFSMDEIKALTKTPFQGNQNIRRAFLFSLYTGLRWCDVRDLKFENVDYSNRVLSFTQIKTEGHSTHANVVTPLTDTTLALIGERGEAGASIFNLPSYTLCSRYVKMWVRRAGIEKNISWHCARHTFAVTLISNKVDIQTVKALMGHSNISMTERYLHVVDELKKDAVEVFPALEL